MTEKTEKAKANVQASARRATRKAKRATKSVKREMDLTGFSPVLVGFLRGLIHAMAMAAITYISTELANLEGAGAIGVIAVIGVGAVRSLEGLLDKVLLGAPPQARMLGGKDLGS